MEAKKRNCIQHDIWIMEPKKCIILVIFKIEALDKTINKSTERLDRLCHSLRIAMNGILLVCGIDCFVILKETLYFSVWSWLQYDVDALAC